MAKPEKKTYTVEQIKQEFYQEFPELKDTVKIIDPRDYKDTEALLKDVRPLLEDEAELQRRRTLQNGNPIMKQQAQNEAAFKKGMVFMREQMLKQVLKTGSPVAMVLGVDPAAETMAGSNRLVFGGNEDLHFETLVWRGLSSGTANTVATFDKSFGDKLQEQIKDKYYLPKELNDPNLLQTFVLDHELGHAATAHMIKQDKVLTHDVPQYWECIADSYALIRHYQRFGEDSKFGEYWSAFRSSAAVMVPDPVHWTSEAMEKVMDLNKQGVLKNLTPKQAIELAVKIADDCGFGLDESPNINKAFGTSPLKAAFTETVGKSVVSTLKGLWSKSAKPQQQAGEEKAEKEDGFLKKMENSFMRQCLDRLENKDNTVRKIGDIALKTQSSAVYRVAKDFVNTIDRIWPDLDPEKLEEARRAVNGRKDVPQTEPERSWKEQMLHDMKTAEIRKHRKNGSGNSGRFMR
ncbi:MAG: hypothetical protein EA357_00240 [Micavibrio sp.]|nr:MAG: hypothetical protein EA357_00240 [Micavibrio sp.]